MSDVVIRTAISEGGAMIWFFCPGCDQAHAITVESNKAEANWTWNSSLERPTISPSIRVRWTYGEQNEPRQCHSFVRDGKIQFLDDCTHTLAGKTVDLQTPPAWMQ